MYILIYIIFSIITLYLIFLILLKNKIETFEQHIQDIFGKRNCLIPSLFEVSKEKMVKHKEIFAEILRLKKIDFLENQFKNELHYTLKTQSFIHNEIDFIFKIANKHNKLLKEEKFSYMKDKIIEKNSEISETLNLYRSIIKKYNSLLQIKNYTIVGILFPFQKKELF